MAYFLKTNKRTGWNKRTGAKCPKLLRSSIFLYTKKMWVFSFSWSFSPFDLKKKLDLNNLGHFAPVRLFHPVCLLVFRKYATLYSYSRTPQDMEGTLTLIFGKSETSGDINTIISPFVYL